MVSAGDTLIYPWFLRTYDLVKDKKKEKKSKPIIKVQSESCSKWWGLKVPRSCDGPSEKGLFSGREKIRKGLRKEMIYEVNLSG